MKTWHSKAAECGGVDPAIAGAGHKRTLGEGCLNLISPVFEVVTVTQQRVGNARARKDRFGRLVVHRKDGLVGDRVGVARVREQLNTFRLGGLDHRAVLDRAVLAHFGAGLRCVQSLSKARDSTPMSGSFNGSSHAYPDNRLLPSFQRIHP